MNFYNKETYYNSYMYIFEPECFPNKYIIYHISIIKEIITNN